ncbi:MAG: hypothetical protein K5896_10035 [Prevotella sp.]|nr:hypothetical protein [Prevotella sp.]
MKQIKYLFVSALLMGFSTAALAQDGTAADIDAVKNLIKSKPADLSKQMNSFYKKNKKNTTNLVAFGQAFLQAGDTINATVAARKALDATKNKCAPAYMLLGDVAVLSDNPGIAAQNYEMAIMNDRNLVDAYRKYATIYRKIDPEGAVAKLEELRQVRPDYPVDGLIGHISYISQRYSTAMDAFSRIPLDQLRKNDYIEYGFCCYLAKKYEKGLEVVTEGLKKNPNDATLTRLAMFCSTETEKFPEAIGFADVLFNKLPKDSVNLSELDYLNYGNALSGNKQFEEAVKQYQEGLKFELTDPSGHANTYMALSDAYKGMEDYPNAMEAYKNYLEVSKDASANDHAGLGSLAMRYARSLAVDENNTEMTAEEKAAKKQAQIEAFKNADQIYADLIEKFPSVKAYGLYQRGMVNSNMDADMSQGLAKPYFEEVINILTQEEELDAQGKRYLETSYRYLMSYNYQVKKDNKAALECAQKILEIKPEDEGIKQVVETLSKSIK